MDTIFSSASSSQKSAIKIIRVSGSETKKIPKMLKKGNTFFEVVAEVQNDIFEIDKTFSIKTEELFKCNNQWFKKFNAVN